MTTTPTSNTSDELREAVKRFCRTDEAADNLVAYIEAHCNKARIDELNQVMGNLGDNRECLTCYNNHSKLEKHYQQLKQGGSK